MTGIRNGAWLALVLGNLAGVPIVERVAGRRWWIATCLAVGLLLLGLLIFERAALIVVLVTSVLGVALVRLAPADRAFFLFLFLAGFGTRVVLAIVVYYLAGALAGSPFVLPDAWAYDWIALDIRDAWLGEPIPDLEVNRYLITPYTTMVAALYLVLGHSPTAVLVLNAAFGAAAAVLIGIATGRLFGQRAARIAALAATFFPSVYFWSILLLKDAFFTFLVAVCIWAFIELLVTRRFVWLVPFALAWLTLADVRSFAFLFIGLSFPVAFLLGSTQPYRRRLAVAGLLAVGAAVLIGMSSAGRLLAYVFLDGDAAAVLEQHRVANAMNADTGFVATPTSTPTVPTSTPTPSATATLTAEPTATATATASATATATPSPTPSPSATPTPVDQPLSLADPPALPTSPDPAIAAPGVVVDSTAAPDPAPAAAVAPLPSPPSAGPGVAAPVVPAPAPSSPTSSPPVDPPAAQPAPTSPTSSPPADPPAAQPAQEPAALADPPPAQPSEPVPAVAVAPPESPPAQPSDSAAAAAAPPAQGAPGPAAIGPTAAVAPSPTRPVASPTAGLPTRTPVPRPGSFAPIPGSEMESSGESLNRPPRGGVWRMLEYLPVGLWYTVTAPLPWSTTKLSQRVTIPDMLLWYACVAMAIVGLVVSRARWRLLVLPIGYLGGIAVMLALVEGNVGTLFRHRAMLIPFVTIFSAAGAVWLWDWLAGAAQRFEPGRYLTPNN